MGETTGKGPVMPSRSRWPCGGQGQSLPFRSSSVLVHRAPWLSGGCQQDPQKRPLPVTDGSGASRSVSGSHQGAGKLLSAPSSHARKTKFHRNVDHLWMRVTFQERPLERGTRKAKTFVLREQDRKGIAGSAQHRMWHSVC